MLPFGEYGESSSIPANVDKNIKLAQAPWYIRTIAKEPSIHLSKKMRFARWLEITNVATLRTYFSPTAGMETSEEVLK